MRNRNAGLVGYQVACSEAIDEFLILTLIFLLLLPFTIVTPEGIRLGQFSILKE
jgi:hypothetical protein